MGKPKRKHDGMRCAVCNRRLTSENAIVDSAVAHTKTCKNCGKVFDTSGSLMGDEGQCQMCWEAECDRSWWETVRDFDLLWSRIKAEVA